MLSCMRRLKIAAAAENKTVRVDRTLRQLASPKRWALRNGGEVEVQTPGTSRAAELMQLYQRLAAAAPGSDERLDALLQVRAQGRLCRCAVQERAGHLCRCWVQERAGSHVRMCASGCTM